MKDKKVVILYRVVQHWRAPVFERVSNIKGQSIEVWHGPDFEGTKVLSTKQKFSFVRRSLISFKLRLNSKNGVAVMPFSPFLILSLIWHSPDVVVCEGASNLVNSCQAFIYCKLFGKRYIWWSLGKIPNRQFDAKRKFIDRVVRFIERHSDAIISYSSRGRDYFLQVGVRPERIYVAVNVVDTDAIISKVPAQTMNREGVKSIHVRNTDFVTLFVGALTAQKSVDMLLKAQRIVEDKGLLSMLVIVGGGPELTNLKELANKLALKQVLFSGPQVEKSSDYFLAGDIFVLPGLGGLAISEAMCYGLPVIASIGDGCEVDLVTKDNGVIDPELSAERLAEYIERYYNDRALMKAHGKRAREIIEEAYNISNYVNQVTKAIHGR